MLHRFQSHSASFLTVAGLGLGLLAFACGGGASRDTVAGPGPVIAHPAATGEGTVAASATAKQDVCHYDKTLGTYSTLSLTPAGVAAHLASHPNDYAGACVTCPCFSTQGINSLAATCSVGLVAQCPVQYSLQLYCSPGPFSQNLGYFEAQLAGTTCVSTTQDTVTGALVTTTIPVNAAQFAACRDAIVTSAPYQTTDPNVCPR